MGPVLALHLAERSGWALRRDERRVESGHLRLTQPNRGEGLARFRDWLQPRLAEPLCWGLVFEAPWDGPRCGREQARQLIGLASVAELTAREVGVARVVAANNLAVRRHFLGRGWGRLAEVRRLTLERCRALGWTPAGDAEAAALALLHWALAQWGLVPEAADAA
jgi:hypothetical protein